MKVSVTGQVMDVVSKEYEFNEKKGTSHKVVVYEEGKVYNIVIKEGDINQFVELIGSNVNLECDIFVKGTYNLKLV